MASLLTSTGLLLGPASPAAAEPEGNFGGAFSEDHQVYAHHPRWMSNLSDNLLIGELSLPATHNSGAIINNNTSQTQTLSIEQQLDAGIRVFDIRYVCKAKNTADNTGPFDKLEYYHGAVNQNLDIVDIFDDFRVFLDANPRETILYSLKNEADNDPLGQPHQDTCGDTRRQAAVDALLGDGRWEDKFYVDTDEDGLDDNNELHKYGTKFVGDKWDTDGDLVIDSDEVYFASEFSDPTKLKTNGVDTDPFRFGGNPTSRAPRLGELRGKMWDFKAGEADLVTKHYLPQSPGGNDAYKVCFTEISGCAYHVGADEVSDPADRADSREKIDVLADFIDDANAGDKNDLYFADMSGSTFVLPRDAARGTSEDSGINGPILNWLVNNHPTYKKVGILSMDFPGPGLISRIIHYNQPYGLLPKPETRVNYPAHGAFPARSYGLRISQDPDAAYEVGVLKADGPCPENSEVSVRLDTEDTNPSNEASGWIGASDWDSHHVTLRFCRVRGDGNIWIPPTVGFYGLLKLGDKCPPYSNEIYRTSDNEDSDNNNQTNGDFMANDLGAGSGYTGPYIGDSTRFTICSFNALDRPAGSTAVYPELGFPYGVFGTPRAGSQSVRNYGWVSADDEDDDNSNDATPDFDSPAWGGMLSGRSRYTVFHMMKVRGAGAPTLTTNPAQPANNGRVAVDYRGTNGNVTVTALTGTGGPAVLTDNPANLDQHITFIVNAGNVQRHDQVPLNSQGKATYNVATLPPGDYDLTMVYDDGRGYFDSAQTSLKITIADDPTAPTISMISPTNGATLGIQDFGSCPSFDPNVPGFGVCGKATSNDPIEDMLVNLRAPNGKWWDGTGFNGVAPLVVTGHVQLSPIPGGYQFFLPINSGLAPSGNYLARIEAAEEIAKTTADVPFTLDNTAPGFTFTNPHQDGASYSASTFGQQCQAPAQRGLCGFIDEPGTGIEAFNVSLQHDGGPEVDQTVETLAVPGVPGRVAWWVPIDPDTIEGGNYLLRAYVRDRGQAETFAERGFALNAEPPEVEVTGPSMVPNTVKLLSKLTDWPTDCGGATSAPKVGRFCGLANDDLGVASVEFSIRNGAYQFYDFTTNTWDSTPNQWRPAVRKLVASHAGRWGIDFPGSLTDGKYTVNVLAKDANSGETDYPVSFVWDTTAPQVEVTINGTPGTGGWYKSAVTITGRDPGALTTTTCVATPAKVEVSTANGSGSVVCTDAFGRSSSPKSFAFKNDMSPPVVKFVTNSAAGPGGWYKTAPSVQAAGTDNFDDTPFCELVGTATNVTNGKSYTGKCTDDAGNITTTTKSFLVDSSLPTVTVSLNPSTANGAHGWYNAAPTGHAAGTDTPSGVYSCQADTAYIGADGEGKSITMTCTDNAGNDGSGSSATFKIDRVGPTVTVAPTTSPDGNSSWYKTKPAFTTTGTDALSLIDAATCSAQAIYAGADSATATQTGSCKDNAGNFTLASSDPFKIDTVAPVVTVAPKTAPNGTNGWYKTKPVIATTGTDATSGIATCTGDATYAGGDSASAGATGACSDNAGWSTSANATPFKVDTTAPTVTVAPSTAPDGANGWYKTNPVIATNGTDATSGIAECSPNATYAGGDSPSATASGTCTDKAGNPTTVNATAFKVDTNAPTVVCPATAPVFLLNDPNAKLVPTVTDGGSGPVAAGTPVATNVLGTFTKQVVGSDLAGNTSTVTCSYQVSYGVKVTKNDKPVLTGRKTSFGISLVDGTGKNVSARTITIELTGGQNPKDTVRWSGRGWTITHTAPSTPGIYTLKFRASGDPVEHSFPYQATRTGRPGALIGQFLGLP